MRFIFGTRLYLSEFNLYGEQEKLLELEGDIKQKQPIILRDAVGGAGAGIHIQTKAEIHQTAHKLRVHKSLLTTAIKVRFGRRL